VRRVVEDDWPRLRRIRLEMLADSPLAFLETVEQARARDEGQWRFRARRGSHGATDIALAAEAPGDRDRWVAYMGCFVATPGQAQVVSVYVSPSQRGSGLVTRMLDELRRWARDEAKVHTLQLYVHESNDRARALYRRYGFTETGATMPYELDRSQREVEMAMPL
jgi:ribosomal protein S18 acetylase RimI-like enzyme